MQVRKTAEQAGGEWRSVTKSEPCPICEHADWCRIGQVFVNCMRIKSDRECGNGGWLHRIEGAEPMRRIERPKEKRISDVELHNRLAPLCRSWYVGQSENIQRLADEIGVAAWALDQLHVGWDGSAWTLPEQNHAGLIVGVNRRLADGGKICFVGSRRGLTYADDWDDAPGPVLIVEGGSDVAAGLTMGLCVVGRPSNVGGVAYLKKLLRKHATRKIIVLAERDRKDLATLPAAVRERHPAKCRGCQLCWPGRYGAVAVADKLWKEFGRRVDWKFLPDGAKDLRAWLVRSGADVDNEQSMLRLRTSLIRRLCRG